MPIIQLADNFLLFPWSRKFCEYGANYTKMKLVPLVNYNMRTAPAPAFLTGPMWGTFVVENENGWWDGTWTGERNEQGFAIMRGLTHGHGDYEGLKAHYEIIRESPDPMATSTVTCYIIDPKGK